MLEKEIERKLRIPIKQELGGLCLKFESPGYTGAPDRLILLPGAKALFAETKKPGEKERARQEYVQRQFRALGFTVFSSVDSPEKVRQVIDQCREVLLNGV